MTRFPLRKPFDGFGNVDVGTTCARGLDAGRAVLDDRAIGGRDAHPRRRVQEEVGRGLARETSSALKMRPLKRS